MLPPELQKVTLTCPSCKKGLSLTLDAVFRKASIQCVHCKTVIEFQGQAITKTLQVVGDVEKAVARMSEVRTEYSKTVERFKAAVSDLLKTAKISS